MLGMFLRHSVHVVSMYAIAWADMRVPQMITNVYFNSLKEKRWTHILGAFSKTVYELNKRVFYGVE